MWWIVLGCVLIVAGVVAVTLIPWLLSFPWWLFSGIGLVLIALGAFSIAKCGRKKVNKEDE